MVHRGSQWFIVVGGPFIITMNWSIGFIENCQYSPSSRTATRSLFLVARSPSFWKNFLKILPNINYPSPLCTIIHYSPSNHTLLTILSHCQPSVYHQTIMSHHFPLITSVFKIMNHNRTIVDHHQPLPNHHDPLANHCWPNRQSPSWTLILPVIVGHWPLTLTINEQYN